MKKFGINLYNIIKAQEAISDIVQQTPLLHSYHLSRSTRSNIYLKLENVQQTGSFKLRGAANKFMNLTEAQKKKGVITVSSGNHGRALAYLSSRMNVPATIGLGVKVPSNKVEAIQQYGAKTLVFGDSYEETSHYAQQVAEESGLLDINPFDDPHIIAGQGTISLEILKNKPEIDTLVVPLSGGGLAGGVVLAAKSINPDIHVVGVSQQGSPVMYHSIKAGKIIEMDEVPTLADGLLGGLGQNNRYSFEICRSLLDETVLVTEEEIGQAIVHMFKDHNLVVEGAGAVGVAALMKNKCKLGKNVAVVLSGGNIKFSVLMDLLEKYNGKDIVN